jgi:hypothetical protein
MGQLVYMQGGLLYGPAGIYASWAASELGRIEVKRWSGWPTREILYIFREMVFIEISKI